MRLRRPGVQVFERGSRSTSFFLPDFPLSIGLYYSIMEISRPFEEISFCQVHQSVECLRRVLRYSRLHPPRKTGQTSGRRPNQTHMDVLRLWNPELFKREDISRVLLPPLSNPHSRYLQPAFASLIQPAAIATNSFSDSLHIPGKPQSQSRPDAHTHPPCLARPSGGGS
jgi:hypothetical protein